MSLSLSLYIYIYIYKCVYIYIYTFSEQSTVLEDPPGRTFAQCFRMTVPLFGCFLSNVAVSRSAVSTPSTVLRVFAVSFSRRRRPNIIYHNMLQYNILLLSYNIPPSRKACGASSARSAAIPSNITYDMT